MKIKLFLCSFLFSIGAIAQDTFSIVAVDSTTGEVGSAGASCVDLFQTTLSNDDFLGVLVPGVGAINTQAYYLPGNQNNATSRMNLGDTPDEIIQWLVQNDVQGTPEIRQYGVAAIINGSPQAAAHTGSSTNDYKNHIVGPNYAIQGNILLGQEVLDSMEARFLAEDGDLACKLMAALQGANMIGADTRCAGNGSSSLFAFVKVAQPGDNMSNPSFKVSVRTHDGAGIEPIDSLQSKFDQLHWCTPASVNEVAPNTIGIYPNPADGTIWITHLFGNVASGSFRIIQLDGKVVSNGILNQEGSIDVSGLNKGTYLVSLEHNGIYSTRLMMKN